MEKAASNVVNMAIGAGIAALLVLLEDKLVPPRTPVWIVPTGTVVLGGIGAGYAYFKFPQAKASSAIVMGSLAAAAVMVVTRTKVTVGSFNPQYVAPSLAGR